MLATPHRSLNPPIQNSGSIWKRNRTPYFRKIWFGEMFWFGLITWLYREYWCKTMSQDRMWSYYLKPFRIIFSIQQIPAFPNMFNDVMESFTKSSVFFNTFFCFRSFGLVVPSSSSFCVGLTEAWLLQILSADFVDLTVTGEGFFSTAWSSAVKAEGEQFGKMDMDVS